MLLICIQSKHNQINEGVRVMFKYLLTFAFVVGVSLVAVGSVNAESDVFPPSCAAYGYENSLSQGNDWINDYPFGPYPDTRGVLVSYPASIAADGIGDRSSIGPINVSIPAGTYDIQLVSFEDHVDSNGAPYDHNVLGQDQEQWYFVATFSDGSTYTSALTNDVPFTDNVTETNMGEIIFADDVVTIEMRHALYGQVDVDEAYHSVIPACFNYTEVVEDQLVLNPEIKLVKTAGMLADNEILNIKGPSETLFVYNITNNGDTYLSNIEIVDDFATVLDLSDDVLIDSQDCSELGEHLAPGEQVTCSVILDVNSSPHVNLAVVTANPVSSTGEDLADLQDVTDFDDAHVIFEEDGVVIGEIDIGETVEVCRDDIVVLVFSDELLVTDVLGDCSELNQVTDEDDSNDEGSVLGATTILANTGSPTAVLTGLGITLSSIIIAISRMSKKIVKLS